MRDLKELIREVLLTNSIKPDCGCGCKGTAKCFEAPILNENLNNKFKISKNLQYHINNKLPLTENTFRYGSESFLNLWLEARHLYSRDTIYLNDTDKEIINETNLGEYGIYEGKMVPLDLPMVKENTDDVVAILNNPNIEDDVKSMLFNAYKSGKLTSTQVIDIIKKTVKEHLNEAEFKGKEVQLGKPKRGGAKKFYVYVKDPKTKKVKKVSFGDTTGLSTKVNNPKARQAFAKRQQCDKKKDRTKAGYWACNIGKYWKSLGGTKNFSGYW
jgi:hypothetical protein